MFVVSGKNRYTTGAITALVQKKRMYVLQPILATATGVISTTMKLQIQKAADAQAAPFWRIRRVQTSGAYSHGVVSQPHAKNVLNLSMHQHAIEPLLNEQTHVNRQAQAT
jgi:hypothetical protein